MFSGSNGPSRLGVLLLLAAARVFAQNPAASVSVDANASRRPINPNIYGFAFGSKSDLAATNFLLNRSGGNGTSTYNWQINATNHDSDWYFESILDPPQTPGYDGDTFITQTRAANVGAQPLLTIPMINYVANLGPGGSMLWSYSIAKYGKQTGSDPYQPDAGNGVSASTGKPITGNNPLDANTPNSVSLQQSWIQHLINTWGTAAAGGLKYYIMDNEPSLWSSTHRDIHPASVTYNELFNDYVTYAGAVRALDPNAMIVGPEEWSWWAMFLSGYDQQNGTGASGSDYNTHSQTYYYPWLLQQLYAHRQSTGKQLIDVLSVHYYPQELSNSNDDSLAGQLVRNQSTRALWDPSYVDPSWFNQVGINGGIVQLIPTLKAWVSQYYPGLQTAITEYNWGDEANLNGATTQADVLGIFGREGLDMATRWTVPANPSPTYLAMEIYRNYDGKLSTFGDTSVSASVANPDNLSSFAAVRASDGALTVMVINKQQGSTPVTISLANFATSGTAQAYQIASATQSSITALGSLAVASNAVSTTVPSQSITLFVIPAGTITSLPGAPSGLAATVESGTVTLTWTAGGGATSYTVKRSVVSGGPYTSVGSVSSATALTYNDAGLANGTTYYYVVSGVNTAGSGPNSAEISATPVAAPTFSSSATASPNPAAQGSTVTIQATVTCASNSLTNGNVQIYVVDPTGAVALTQNFTGQNFTAQQSHTYSASLTPTLAGTYTVEVGVFSATWQQWNWNSSAAAIAVNSSVAFTTSASAPAVLTAGGTAAISLTVTETGSGSLANGNVELQIFNASGTAVATQVWSSQNFAANQSLPYSYSWTSAASLPPGTYSVDVGVFDGGWAHDYYWNTDATITVTAPGAATPVVSLSSSSLSFGSQNVASAGSAQSVTLTNSGTGPLTIAGIAIGGANPGDFSETNTCGSSLAAGAKCSISATFHPTVAGSRNATIAITDNAAASPQSLTLSGTGVGVPVSSLGSTSLSFGSQTVGTAGSAQSVTLSNTGTGPLVITNIAVSGTNSGDFTETNTCGSSLAAGANCSISATFKPMAVGSRSATIAVTSNAAGSPQSIALSGTGVGVPVSSLGSTSLSFGSQTVGTAGSAQSVTLSNTGTGPLVITNIAVSGTNSGDFTETNTCGSSLAAGANCSISATFKPMAVGSRSATIAVTSNAAGSPQLITLSGTGVGGPVSSLSSTSLSFGSQTVGVAGSAQAVTLSNTGTGPLAITSIVVSGANPGDFTENNTCGSSVAAGANCSISATFQPAAVGNRSAAIAVTSNAAGSPQAIALSGVGVGVPAVSLSSTSLSFGSQTVGVAGSAQSVTLTNTGAGPLAITGIVVSGANPGDFTETNTCGSSVAASAACSISVTFKPAAAGNRSATVTITDSAAGSPQSVALSGSGQGVPALSLSASALMFPNEIVGVASAAKSVTLTNTGNATLSIAAIAITGADAADFSQSGNCGASLAVALLSYCGNTTVASLLT